MLSFEPKYHQQITDGELVGSWVPIFPPAGAKTDVFLVERIREGERIQVEGGSIVIIDPMGDSAMIERLHKIGERIGENTNLELTKSDVGTPPSIEEVKALDGRIFAMLNADEEAVLNFYRDQGRKFGVSVSIINEADPEELARASSRQQADQIMKRANSRIHVTVA